MSNTVSSDRFGPALVPAGDYGLGLCLDCLGELIGDPKKAPPPQFAVTMLPIPQTAVTPSGPMIFMVAVPTCWQHVQAAGQQRQADHQAGPPSPIVRANGRVRR